MAKPKHRKPSQAKKNIQRAATVTTGGMAAIAVGTSIAPAPALAAPNDVWAGVIECESGGDTTAQNPSSSASGLYQIIDSTWVTYGGLQFAPRAKDATPEQQRIVAEAILAGQGPSAWAEPCNNPLNEWVAAGSPVPAPVVPEAPPATPQEDVYIVQPGDWLSAIAPRVGMTTLDLYNANRDVIGSNPDRIYPGQVFFVGGILLPNPPVVVDENPPPAQVETAAEAGAQAEVLPVPQSADLSVAIIQNSAGSVSPNTQLAANKVFTYVPGAQLITFGGTRASARDPHGHPSGNAIDYMVLSDAPLGDKIVQYNIDHWTELGVEYIIWQQRIMTSPSAGWQWMEDRGSTTQNHYDHVHVNYNA